MILTSFIECLKAILYGVVEGITEWMPVSSTGHMILLDEWAKLDVSKEFWELFLVVIQLGAIMAVIVTFFKKLWPFSKVRTKEERKDVLIIWRNIIIASFPAAIIGLFLDDYLDAHFYNFYTVAAMLILYGILFIVLEVINKKKDFKITNCKDITWKMSLIIGLIQILALIPGTSRSGVTILGAMLIGIDRTSSIEFSFFLSIPIMLGASLLKGFKFFYNGNVAQTNEWLLLAIGSITAFLVSLLIINFLMSYIKKHDFSIFAIYRVIFAIIILIKYLCF